jgi:16S rRNA processing protein RimM
VLGKHGLRGALRVAALTDFPAQLRRRKRLYLGEQQRPVEVVSVRGHGDALIVQLAEVATPEQAAVLYGQTLYIRREEASRLGRGEFFLHQVVGLSVETTDGRQLGRVEDVLRTGANDVYVVRGALGEVLVPAIAPVVKQIDPDGGRLLVELMPGMLPGED